MRSSKLIALALAPLFLLPFFFSSAQESGESEVKVRAYTNATIYPVSSAKIEKGTLLIQGDTILAVGPAGPCQDSG